MKTTSILLMTAIVLLVVMTAGCATRTRGSFKNEAISLSDLHKRNYQLIKPNVLGESYGFNFLIFPIFEAQLAKAKQDMYEKVEASGIKLEGRSIFLTNTTEECGGLNLLLFSIPRLTITADFMEFVGDEKPEKAPSLHIVP